MLYLVASEPGWRCLGRDITSTPTVRLTEGQVVRVGRSSDMDISLIDPAITRYHFGIWQKDGQVWAQSPAFNRIAINSVMMPWARPAEVRPGDVLQLGDVRLNLLDIDPAWRTPTAVQVAQAVHRSCNFKDLPVLADAVEDAGCTCPELLAHLRGPGPHVLRCWALYLVLNKE